MPVPIHLQYTSSTHNQHEMALLSPIMNHWHSVFLSPDHTTLSFWTYLTGITCTGWICEEEDWHMAHPSKFTKSGRVMVPPPLVATGGILKGGRGGGGLLCANPLALA